MVPALPPCVGPNPAKAKFFTEAAASFELMALFYELTPEEQTELRRIVAGFAAAAAKRKTDQKGNPQ